ncbi:MAG: DUF4335 domain-containing protein [Cyanobacteria bacterium]|nr:DUF4335 domain-containing protein [Cyanobacteria bacterium bin.51]
MKLSYRFEQTSCRLRLDGLPDYSAGQGQDVIGILTGWELSLAGHPALEGKREHLAALMQAVLPYARHLVSGVPRRFGGEDNPVQIQPMEGEASVMSHRVLVRSSQPDTSPLELAFDDAELSDLVRCLDQVRLDPRVQVDFALPAEQPLPRREILERIPLRQRLASPLAAMAALAITTSIGLMLPLPRRPAIPTANPAATEARPEAAVDPVP